MASKKHLDLLHQGKEIWNDWREQNPAEIIDLSGAKIRERNLSGFILTGGNLSRIDLSGSHLYRSDLYKADLTEAILQKTTLSQVDLSEVDLSQADLSEANISKAKLTGAKLLRANLSGARLVDADLISADLSEANVSKAKLTGAKLRRANFTGTKLTGADLVSTDLAFTNFAGADLQDADLAGASFAFTILGNTNLKNVRHLDSCTHRAPSIIDQMTLLKTSRLPEQFLRGCGLSDEFIQSLQSLFWSSKSDEFFSCFISYSHADADFVHRLYDALQARGIRCWLDEIQLAPGDDILTSIDMGIRIWDKVLLCCSRNSLEKSWWVTSELEKALQKEQRLFMEREEKVLVLIPLNLDNYLFTDWQGGMKSEVVRRVAADFTQWKTADKFEAEFEKLLQALRPDRKMIQQPPKPKL